MLTSQDQQELIRIIENLYDFTDGGNRTRRLLLTQAGLRQYVPVIDLSGTASIVAQDIVGQLEAKGYLVPERPNYHALGALLSYLLTTVGISYEQSQFLARLIVRYSLVIDTTYINELRSQYNISDVPISPSVPALVQTSLPTTLPKTEEPTFRIFSLDEQGFERIINSQDNFLDLYLSYARLNIG
ncbi:MAG: hypothetical protein E6J34_18525 [Chloroflexi bacterium]|nr:MAG: hypothetical protein E6J34_18525 [Chloroflexota bacterium]